MSPRYSPRRTVLIKVPSMSKRTTRKSVVIGHFHFFFSIFESLLQNPQLFSWGIFHFYLRNQRASSPPIFSSCSAAPRAARVAPRERREPHRTNRHPQRVG